MDSGERRHSLAERGYLALSEAPGQPKRAKEPGWRSAHRRQVGKVDRQRLVADVLESKVREREMNTFHHCIGGNAQISSRGWQDGAIVSRAGRRAGCIEFPDKGLDQRKFRRDHRTDSFSCQALAGRRKCSMALAHCSTDARFRISWARFAQCVAILSSQLPVKCH